MTANHTSKVRSLPDHAAADDQLLAVRVTQHDTTYAAEGLHGAERLIRFLLGGGHYDLNPAKSAACIFLLNTSLIFLAIALSKALAGKPG